MRNVQMIGSDQPDMLQQTISGAIVFHLIQSPAFSSLTLPHQGIHISIETDGPQRHLSHRRH